MRNEVAVISSDKIDRSKWDSCIEECSNGLIYASSVYLDHMTDNWTGIVMNDYSAVMPVAWRKKYGIRYSYAVPFIQQSGIFSAAGEVDSKLFVDALFSICRYGDYPFNFANRVEGTSSHTNYILNLDCKYEVLATGFSNDAVQNIRRSMNQNLAYLPGEIEEAVNIYCTHYAHRGRVPERYFERFKKMCILLKSQGKLLVRRVTGKGGNVLATAVFPRDKRRLYNVMNSTLPEGKTQGANYFLLSGVWKEFQESRLVFDFEGSDIPGVRDFYRKFGGKDQSYNKLHFNHLPWPIKTLKK